MTSIHLTLDELIQAAADGKAEEAEKLAFTIGEQVTELRTALITAIGEMQNTADVLMRAGFASYGVSMCITSTMCIRTVVECSMPGLPTVQGSALN